MNSIVILGLDHSTLAPLARAAAERNGFTIQNDPLPEEVRFIRSDQYSFVEKGIPAITYKGGLVSADPAIDAPRLPSLRKRAPIARASASVITPPRLYVCVS